MTKGTSKFKKLTTIKVAPSLSTEQAMLGELFGQGDRVLFGGEDSLPRMNGVLISGSGLIKSEDEEKETASMFGF